VRPIAAGACIFDDRTATLLWQLQALTGSFASFSPTKLEVLAASSSKVFCS
jgi:hypothetical protein